ncbi:MAG: hypothetical protein U0232_17180 [Thermomicrobiales bacterium]
MMVTLRAANDPRRWQPVAMLVALSWLGEFVHNALSLPTLTPLSPENSLLALIAASLVVGWRLSRSRRLVAAMLFGWGTVHLVGGAVITVLPFPFLPFVPEQTVAHYFAHLLYGLAQVPLIVAMIGHLRAPDVRDHALDPRR